jgi:hypothetical protein
MILYQNIEKLLIYKLKKLLIYGINLYDFVNYYEVNTDYEIY